jgi:quinol monooxygenase YgiN
MPHVTSFKFKAKPGERQAVIDNFQRWERERKSKAKGFVRSVLVSNLRDADEFMATVVFDSTESYNANSNNPEQGDWYTELRSHLTADPEWFDGKLEAQATA